VPGTRRQGRIHLGSFSHTVGKVKRRIHRDVVAILSSLQGRRRHHEAAQSAKLPLLRLLAAYSKPTAPPAIQKGLDYYKRVADSLLEAKSAPSATLYTGISRKPRRRGRLAESDLAARFVDYSQIVAKALGDASSTGHLNEPGLHLFSATLGAFTPPLAKTASPIACAPLTSSTSRRPAFRALTKPSTPNFRSVPPSAWPIASPPLQRRRGQQAADRAHAPASLVHSSALKGEYPKAFLA